MVAKMELKMTNLLFKNNDNMKHLRKIFENKSIKHLVISIFICTFVTQLKINKKYAKNRMSRKIFSQFSIRI